MRIATLLVFAATIVACSTFGSDDPPPADSPAPSSDLDGGGADGAHKPVDGKPGVLTPVVGGPVRITQGGSAKAHVTINRGGVTEVIRVTAVTSPTGIVVKDVILSGTMTEGDLELTALGNAPQGTASVSLKASVDDGASAMASFDVFVRGTPGTMDTTFGASGVSDLGAATNVTARASDNHVFVATDTIRRFNRDGAPDSTFAAVPGGTAYFAIANDESIFTGTIQPRHFLSNGTEDAAYTSTAIPFRSGRAVAVLGAAEFVLLSNSMTLGDPRLNKWNANGTVDTNFAFTPTSDKPTAGFKLEARADGTLFVGFLDDSSAGAVAHVLATGTLDPAFAGGSGYALFNAAEFGVASMQGMRVTNDGIYVLGGAGKTPYLTLAKFNIDGSTSSTFGDAGTPGQLKTPTRPIGTTAAIDVDAKKRVVMAGVTTVAGVNQLALIRFDPLGGLDTSLSSTGVVAFPFGAVSPRAVFVVDDERVLVLGLRDGNGFIARFWM